MEVGGATAMAAPCWLQLVSALVVVLVVCLAFMKRSRSSSQGDVLFPRGPPSWPILGHLPLLLSGCSHRKFAQLSRQHGYGPIIGLRLGSMPTVVACTFATAKEFLITHGKAFANRPHFLFVDTLFYGYNNSVAFSSDSPTWTKLRKIYTLHLLTAKRLQELQHVRLDSVRGLLRRLHEASAGGGEGARGIQLRNLFGEMVAHTMSRLVQSKTLSEAGGESLAQLLEDLEHDMVPLVGDFIPWLKCLDFFRLRRMRKVHARFDQCIDAIVSERRKAMHGSQAHELPHDFLQVLLSKEATEEAIGGDEEELITTKLIKASIVDILVGGIHTTTLTLEWGMAELLRNPRCLSKLQEEIDEVMCNKGEELVRDEFLKDLPYLDKVVKEVLRLHPPGPLLFPHISSVEVKVDKYTLPPHTLLMVNVWDIGRDPKVWENGDKFLPERFERKEIDLYGKNFDLLPFGGGRRICPGMRLAFLIISITLANIVKTFDWELPQGKPLNMSERGGITCCMAKPLLATPKHRHTT